MKDRFKVSLYRLLFFINSLMLFSCAEKEYIGQEYIKPNQVEITRLIWNEGYDQSSEPPAILWVENDLLDCGGLEGIPGKTGWLVNSHCIDGRTYKGDFFTQVAFPTNPVYTTTWAYLSIIDEYCHIWSGITTGDLDSNHTKSCNNEGLVIPKIREFLLNNGY